MKRVKPKKKLKKKSLGRRIDALQPEQRKMLAAQLTAMLEKELVRGGTGFVNEMEKILETTPKEDISCGRG